MTTAKYNNKTKVAKSLRSPNSSYTYDTRQEATLFGIPLNNFNTNVSVNISEKIINKYNKKYKNLVDKIKIDLDYYIQETKKIKDEKKKKINMEEIYIKNKVATKYDTAMQNLYNGIHRVFSTNNEKKEITKNILDKGADTTNEAVIKIIKDIFRDYRNFYINDITIVNHTDNLFKYLELLDENEKKLNEKFTLDLLILLNKKNIEFNSDALFYIPYNNTYKNLEEVLNYIEYINNKKICDKNLKCNKLNIGSILGNFKLISTTSATSIVFLTEIIDKNKTHQFIVKTLKQNSSLFDPRAFPEIETLSYEYNVHKKLNIMRKYCSSFPLVYFYIDCATSDNFFKYINTKTLEKKKLPYTGGNICKDISKKYSSQTTDTRQFLIMEYIPGIPLKKFIYSLIYDNPDVAKGMQTAAGMNKPPSPDKIIIMSKIFNVILHMACSISLANIKMGFVHGDLHLENVMVKHEKINRLYIHVLDEKKNIYFYTRGNFVPYNIDFGFSTTDYNNFKVNVLDGHLYDIKRLIVSFYEIFLPNTSKELYLYIKNYDKKLKKIKPTTKEDLKKHKINILYDIMQYLYKYQSEYIPMLTPPLKMKEDFDEIMFISLNTKLNKRIVVDKDKPLFNSDEELQSFNNLTANIKKLFK